MVLVRYSHNPCTCTKLKMLTTTEDTMRNPKIQILCVFRYLLVTVMKIIMIRYHNHPATITVFYTIHQLKNFHSTKTVFYCKDITKTLKKTIWINSMDCSVNITIKWIFHSLKTLYTRGMLSIIKFVMRVLIKCYL